MFQLSHIQCRVNDIHSAVKDFENLGFTVMWGTYPKKAANAFVWFEEGPFIELFQMKKAQRYMAPFLQVVAGKPLRNRWMYWYNHSEGWCDFALEAKNSVQADRNNLDKVNSYVKTLGIRVSTIINGKRERPDGDLVKYGFFAADPVELPFIVSAYDPRQHPKNITHLNGANKISCIKIGVESSHMKSYKKLCKSDNRIYIVPSNKTQILEVVLSGLNIPLNGKISHNAIFIPEDNDAIKLISNNNSTGVQK